MQFRKLLPILLLLTFFLGHINAVTGHGGETEDTHDTEEPMSLSLDTILLITILAGILLLLLLSSHVGIDDKQFLIKIAIITLVLLILDYTYIKYFK